MLAQQAKKRHVGSVLLELYQVDGLPRRACLHVSGVAHPPLPSREAVLPLHQQKPGVALHAQRR